MIIMVLMFFGYSFFFWYMLLFSYNKNRNCIHGGTISFIWKLDIKLRYINLVFNHSSFPLTLTS